eukprot:gene662-957_t
MDGSLAPMVRRFKPAKMADIEVRYVMAQVMSTLAVMHSGQLGLVITHRDVKPANVLVKVLPGGQVLAKLADFGCCSISHTHVRAADPQAGAATSVAGAAGDAGCDAESEMNSFIGTSGYQAPDMQAATAYNSSVDVWAAGVMAFEILFAHLAKLAQQEA